MRSLFAWLPALIAVAGALAAAWQARLAKVQRVDAEQAQLRASGFADSARALLHAPASATRTAAGEEPEERSPIST